MGRAKVINVVLENGTLDGVVQISNKSGDDVVIFSAPRKSVDNLLEIDESNNFGVYLLLSDNKVYVGQSTDLKSRIKNHISNKEWWNRVVLMTTTSNKFNHSDIDYLESVLIDKAQKNHSLDTENKKSGNKFNIQRGDQITLDNYLEDAMFLLDFIGVSVFGEDDKNSEKQRIHLVSTKVMQLVQRANAVKFLQEQGYIGKDYSYAKREDKKDLYPIDPQVAKIESDWIIVLNDIVGYKFTILRIPANTIAGDELKKFKRRKDDSNKLTMKIEGETFVEKRSGFDFSPYVVEIIPYDN